MSGRNEKKNAMSQLNQNIVKIVLEEVVWLEYPNIIDTYVITECVMMCVSVYQYEYFTPKSEI